ncbi:alpha/beta hydrolase [Natronosalvus rutilus]|uniref:alpha/beta hydrolase n=1 Tax=Natronosalvus rutilus TaxID=2953753 RepID=UPI0031B9FF32
MTNTLHPQARAALDEREDAGIPPGYALSTACYREQFRESMTTQSTVPVKTSVDVSIPGPATDIPVRTYHPGGDDSLPIVEFFHDDGSMLGDLDCFDSLCTRLADQSGCLIVSIGYRLTPEHPFRAPLRDCYAAVSWLSVHAANIGGDPNRIAVSGTSAGADLAAAIALLARDRDGPCISHQALLYPPSRRTAWSNSRATRRTRRGTDSLPRA